ncbi:MAG: hypothetical protein AUK34_01365 [Ignavibacteria bacterium CG2_30_36_16]|nr:MAG: hypothetical protein AUK34_01365 [Ignavibacteria bacterium CG2_30_36_16]
MMKKILIFLFAIITLTGCDSVYKYVFLPPERIEYTLVPDKEAIGSIGDTSYYISKDGLAAGYNAKDWKIEVRYMSDYQLNNFEFPEESKQGQFSGNPYTYGNWIDPALGYTPRRFTVFKVTIYNYTGSKMNFDPEITLLQTDRGDNLHAYGREQKNAKYGSIEEYYTVRKGSGGVDDDIFETRMGIARRTMLYYGKPIYKGDSRDGLVVFDPIVDEVGDLKVTVNDLVLEYDENNDPGKFIDVFFYFKQIPLDKSSIKKTDALAGTDSTGRNLNPSVKMVQAKYVNEIKVGNREIDRKMLPVQNQWDPNPVGLETLAEYVEEKTNLSLKLYQAELSSETIKDAKILFITGVAVNPRLQENLDKIVTYIEGGGFVFMDVTSFISSEKSTAYFDFEQLAAKLGSGAKLQTVSLDHPIFSQPNKLSSLPEGYERMNPNVEPSFSLRGIFLQGKLVAVEASKSYIMLWSNEEETAALNFAVNLINYASKLKK